MTMLRWALLRSAGLYCAALRWTALHCAQLCSALLRYVQFRDLDIKPAVADLAGVADADIPGCFHDLDEALPVDHLRDNDGGRRDGPAREDRPHQRQQALVPAGRVRVNEGPEPVPGIGP